MNATTNPLKVSHPIFEIKPPLSKTTLSARPWTVKEERILLGAKESGNAEDISLAVQQTIRNCVLDENFDINKLTTIDIDYIFIKIRGAAVGDIVRVDFICNNVPEGQTEECRGEFQFVIDLKDMKPSSELKKDFDEVELTNEYNIKFRYPQFNKIRTIKGDDEEFVQTAKKIQAVVDYVAPKNKDAKEIVFDDLSIDFITEFIESLTTSQFAVINDFMEAVPEMAVDTKAKCPKCGHEHEGHFENLSNFF